jgi:phosphoglycerol transferase
MRFLNLKLKIDLIKIDLFAYLICIILSVFGSFLILQLWNSDITVPFAYCGDSLEMMGWFKGVIDNPWWYHNNYLGMPFGLDHYDWPLTNNFNILIIKIIGMITNNAAIVFNLYYLLTFPFIAISGMFLFRQLNISISLSIFGSVLYTFVPYHFLRGQQHIFLSDYFLLPLALLVVIWVFQGKLVLYDNNHKKFLLKNYHSAISLIICIMITLSTIYYLFFFLACIFTVCFYKTVSEKSTNSIITGLILIFFVAIIFCMANLPVFIHTSNEGSNSDALIRHPAETEIYGLKITQLLMPIQGHRISLFDRLAQYYASSAPLVNENSAASLGIIGSIGFIFLLLWLVFRCEWVSNFISERFRDIMDCLSILNISALLFATLGGFWTYGAYLLSFPLFRALNRISILIALFSIFAFIILLECIKKRNVFNFKKKVFFVFIGLLLIGGILDQTSVHYTPNYAQTNQSFMIDKQFIEKIENELPKGSMIFQLPYLPYPESPPINKMADYSHIRAYIHSKDLKWSYGVIKGRMEADWIKGISEQDISTMVKSLALSGFNGIYIDSYGYVDSNKILGDLSKKLNTTPLVSEDKRLYFFSLVNYTDGVKKDYSDLEWELEKKRVMNPYYVYSYNLGSAINFSVDGNSRKYQKSGWSDPWEDFSWTQGNKAILCIQTEKTNNNLNLTIKSSQLTNQQRVNVMVNNHPVGNWIFDKPDVQEKSIIIPHGLLNEEVQYITFELPDAKSPLSLGLSDDGRELALAVRSIVIDEKRSDQ